MTHPSLGKLEMTHPSLGKLEMTHPSLLCVLLPLEYLLWAKLRDYTISRVNLRDLKMTHQIGIRNTLHEERFYVDGALVIASSLRNTEIKQILSVWSLQAFLRLLGRSREMTRGP